MKELWSPSGTLAWAAEYPVCAASFVQRFTDFDFLIALIMDRDEKYRSLFLEDNGGRYRILDSGIFEDPQNPIDNKTLLRWAYEANVDEVVAIDLINDCTGTLDRLNDFLAMDSQFPFKVQGVVQGSTLSEWLYCYEEMVNNPRVDVIGLAYFDTPDDLKGKCLDFTPDEAENARLTLLQLIAGGIACTGWDGEIYRSVPKIKPIHLLGIRHPQAIKYYRQYPFIRSIDTSFPVQLGIEGHPFDLDAKKPFYKMNFGAELNRASSTIAAENCFRFAKLCHGREDVESWELFDRLTPLKV